MFITLDDRFTRMDRVEHGTGVEPDRGLEGSFGRAADLTDPRTAVEFVLFLVLVVALAAATSVVLVPI